MFIRIAVDPALNLSLDDFTTEWNADPTVPGNATIEHERSGAYGIPPEYIQQGIIYLTGIATATLLNPAREAMAEFVKERLKTFLDEKFPKTKEGDKPEITWVRQGGGGLLMVVHKREEA